LDPPLATVDAGANGGHIARAGGHALDDAVGLKLLGPYRPASSDSPQTRAFFKDRVQPSPGGRVEMKAITRDIRALASTQGVALRGIGELLDDIATICQEMGIEIESVRTRGCTAWASG
jgi:hypothetical protein